LDRFEKMNSSKYLNLEFLLLYHYVLFIDRNVTLIDFQDKKERIVYFYCSNNLMKKHIDIKVIRFYLWTGFGFFLLYSFAEFFEYRDTIIYRIINSVILISYLTFLNYLLFEIALPLFRLPLKKFFSGILLVLALMVLYSFGLYGWRYLWIQLHIYSDFGPQVTFIKGVKVHSQFSMATILFFAIVRNIYNNIKLKQAAQQLLTEKKEAELNYLKAQTNPHFLFNTLNNIYSLARDKSDLAPESILRLSKILRFMLYETGGEYIVIEDELKIMNDYIALEKLRYDDSLQINFNIEIDDIKQSLPPLLLIPLVENAFKHGVSETRNLPFVDISLSVKQQQLQFIVKNSAETSSAEQPVKENIGLSNLRRQLQLLYKEYDLSVKQDESVFISMLKINLSSHV
jgi:two-component system, LytTR family, sensor kinase